MIVCPGVAYILFEEMYFNQNSLGLICPCTLTSHFLKFLIFFDYCKLTVICYLALKCMHDTITSYGNEMKH